MKYRRGKPSSRNKARADRSHREKQGWRRKLRETNNDTESCCPVTGKLAYLSEQQAWQKRKTTAVVPYQCPYCKLWHHTHAKGAK